MAGDKRAVKKEVAQEYAEKHGLKYYQTSAKSGQGVNQIFMEPAKQLITDIQ